MMFIKKWTKNVIRTTKRNFYLWHSTRKSMNVYLFSKLFPTGRQIFIPLLVLISCGQSVHHSPDASGSANTGQSAVIPVICDTGRTIGTRFNPPPDYNRLMLEASSFAQYLRNLPLKDPGSEVLYYDGSVKKNRGVYAAVIDLPIGNRDLHQCADAVIRLRAEYLYDIKAFDSIHFNFTNGFCVDYSEWMDGKRIRVQGNKTWWEKAAPPSDSYAGFWKYLETLFMYAGTLSLSNEMKPVKTEEMRIGDVFIRGGSPGHAVIVVDMARNSRTGETIFMLAQSYMPAQELQILANPSDNRISPWYSLDFGEVLPTPEWTFSGDELKRFH
jgi:hypothetical protein